MYFKKIKISAQFSKILTDLFFSVERKIKTDLIQFKIRIFEHKIVQQFPVLKLMKYIKMSKNISYNHNIFEFRQLL